MMLMGCEPRTEIGSPYGKLSEYELVLDAAVQLGGPRNGTDGPSLLGVAGGLFIDSTTVAAADPFNKDVRIFSVGGRYLRSLGRQGSGPGEYRGIGKVVRALPGEIAVWDTQLKRVTRFRVGDGSYTTIPVDIDDLHKMEFIGALGDSGWVFRMMVPPQRPPPNDLWSEVWTGTQRFLRVAPGGTSVTTLTEVHGEERVSRATVTSGVGGSVGLNTVIGPLFGTRILSGIDQTGLVTASSDSLSIQKWASDGSLLLQHSLPGRKGLAEEWIVEEVRASILDSIRSAPSDMVITVGGLTLTSQSQAVKANEDRPSKARLPEFTRVIHSSDGFVWMEMFDPPSSPARRWLRLDARLRPEGTVLVPRSYGVLDFRDEMLLAVETDQLGVEKLMVVPMRQAPKGTVERAASR